MMNASSSHSPASEPARRSHRVAGAAPLAVEESQFLADVVVLEPVEEYPYEDDAGATTIAAFHRGDGWSAVACETEGLFIHRLFGITRTSAPPTPQTPAQAGAPHGTNSSAPSRPARRWLLPCPPHP